MKRTKRLFTAHWPPKWRVRQVRVERTTLIHCTSPQLRYVFLGSVLVLMCSYYFLASRVFRGTQWAAYDVCTYPFLSVSSPIMTITIPYRCTWASPCQPQTLAPKHQWAAKWSTSSCRVWESLWLRFRMWCSGMQCCFNPYLYYCRPFYISFLFIYWFNYFIYFFWGETTNDCPLTASVKHCLPSVLWPAGSVY